MESAAVKRECYPWCNSRVGRPCSCADYQPSADKFREVAQKMIDAHAPAAPTPTTETILQEAARLTGDGGERNDSYDHPYPNFSKIAATWSVIFGVPVAPRQVALALILMKVVRDNHRPKRDNIVDIAGYARCIERLAEWKGPVPPESE